jgi:hypothetical protein
MSVQLSKWIQRAGEVAQVRDHLPSKSEDLSSSPRTAKKKPSKIDLRLK